MKSKTAVEWLENEFKEAYKMFGGIDTNWIKRFEQAKQMEKESIIDAYDAGLYDETFCEKVNAERYYNETFKSE